jgi:PAS domain S-box-containing protein
MGAEASAAAGLCEAALASHPDGMLVLDEVGRIAFANRAAELSLGIEPGHAVGKYLADATIGLPTLGAALARGETMRKAEHAATRADGTHLVLEVDGAPIRDASGALRGAVASIRPRASSTSAESFEANLQRFLDTVLAPVVIHYEGRVEYANPATLEMLGYEARDVIGHDMWEFVAPDELPLLAQRVESAKGGVSQPVREDRFLARDGRVVHVEAVSVALLYHGRPCVASIGRDVTEARRYQVEREELLAEIDAQRQLFQAIYEEVPAGIAILAGPSFEVEMANPAFRAFAPSYTMKGKRLGEIILDMREIAPILDRVMETGKSEHVSSMPIAVRRTRDAPSETAYFTFAVARVRSPLGQHLAVVGMAVETTEEVRAHRRAAELAEIAQQRAAQLDSIIETMGDAVFVSDRDGTLMLANQSGLRLLGVSSLAEADVILGEKPALSCVRRADGSPTPQHSTPLSRALAGESVSLEAETVVGREGREVFVRANARPIRADGAIVGAVEVATDVSPLVEFDRLKDQFVRVAAHELKTPVTIMKGYAQALLRGCKTLTSAERAKLEAVDRGADRMDRAVRKLLDLSQLHLGRLQLSITDVDVEAIVERVVARSAAIHARHRLVIRPTGEQLVRGDAERLEYVVTGLVDNAVRYSPDGGDIEVDVTDTDAEVVVSVRDHGVGVPADRQEHLFERFYRAHTDTPYDYGGMGIDLFLCREMVNRMGGRMWFESKEGHGSTFHIALPPAKGRRAA